MLIVHVYGCYRIDACVYMLVYRNDWKRSFSLSLLVFSGFFYFFFCLYLTPSLGFLHGGASHVQPIRLSCINSLFLVQNPHRLFHIRYCVCVEVFNPLFISLVSVSFFLFKLLYKFASFCPGVSVDLSMYYIHIYLCIYLHICR